MTLASRFEPPRKATAEKAVSWSSKNEKWSEQLALLFQYAQHGDIPILLEGESGTGKTRIARDIDAASPRSHEPFKELTISSIEDTLAASELFGHVAGAFTDARHARAGAFISASGGTLFLDEIGKASEKVQMKLLGSVETGIIVQQGADREVRVNVRIVSASNIPIQLLVESGRFLPDLAARLGMFRFSLPPLRDRREDIADIALAIVQRRFSTFGFEMAPTIDEELAGALERADWPLNIRELDAAMQRVMLEARLRETDVLTLAHCTGDLKYLVHLAERRLPRELPHQDIVREVRPAESRADLAKRLRISEATLYRRLRSQDQNGGQN